MSFYTSLTGLNGAQADIAAISNNIANVGTTGFKRSRAEFGDIFATSPLQAASSAIGSGTILKSIKQQFTQGNIESSLNALDLAISGQGFFALKPSLTSTQTVYTRNGAFSVNNDRYVVDSQGQLLQVFPVNADGSVIATGIQSAQNLQLPTTSGLPKASQTIQLGLNLPADAEIIPAKSQYTSSNPYVFDKTNPATYNKSTSITIYDSLGNPTIATIYYVKTSNATETSPTNKWQTHVFVGDREVTPQLITAKDDQSRSYYINKFGQITTDPQAVDPTFNAAAAHPLFKQDDQNDKTASTAASAVGAIIKTSGFDFGDTDATPVTIYTDPDSYALTKEGGRDEANPPYWGRDMFSISVDGSEPQSVSIKAGTYTGTQLAAEMTRAVNEKYSSQKYFSITDTYRKDSGAIVPGNDVIQLNLSKLSEDGATIPLNPPLEIDLLGTGGGAGTPQAGNAIQPDNKLTLTRDQLISLTQQKLNDALSKRRLELSKGTDWPDASNPPITVGYDVGARALTFTVDPTQLGADANEPAARFNSLQVFNPTSLTNDLGLPTRSASPDILVRANTVWTGSATLPSGDYVLDPREQRTGIKVSYNKDTRQFVFSSGSTGETSSIKVGRSEIAETATAQVSAFDMSAVSFADATSTSPLDVAFEVNGRALNFRYVPTSGTGSKEDFFRKLDQHIPVNFAPTKKTEATSSQPEKQTIDVYGRVMKGDKFELTLTLPGKTPQEQTLTVNLATATLTETSSLDDRIAALGTAITSAINTAYSPSAAGVTVEASDDKIVLTYPTAGTTTVLASLKQVTRGSDVSTFTAVNLTDQSILTAKTVRIDGTVSTATQYDITLRDPDNNAPSFHVGDVFRITMPNESGSETSYDVTVPAYGGKTSGQTFSSMTDFVEALKTASNLPTDLNLSYLTGATDTFTAKIGTSGNISGALTFEKIKDCRVVSGSPVTKTVRPDPVGEFYFDHQGNNLEVVGNRNGEAFRMNVRIDGEVKTALPVGAANNPNGANGVQIGQAKTISLNKGSNDLLGVGLGANVNYVSGTGLPSSAATAIGTTAITSMSQTFFLNESLGENRMTFTVDGIVGTITLPIRAYTGDTFATAIQDRVNQIQDPKTGRIVSGVSVKFDPDNNRLIFTSGTTGQNSQINVVGHPNFGLGKVTQTAGSVPVITNLKQATDDQGNKLYVTADGEVTTADPGSQQNWYPLYLTEGQLTFDTVGKLISPKEGVIYSPFDPQNGSDLLRLNIDYGKYSTQFSSPFSVLSLSQDGYPSGSLNGLDIDAGGTIRANYTNGQTVALGKVMIANFANPNGLKQIGNANYVATSTSGQVVLGQAGADGFGNIKAGALERSNVDITEELVNLITAQRNFQANAKAIETTTQLSQTIIQIRG